jgi:hypothetical protein
MERLGMIRTHWVTEWQRRGVPHLHAAVWWPADQVQQWGSHNIENEMVNAWVQMSRKLYGTGFKGQHVQLITGAVGWFQYLSKHAARGVKHYQRSSENVPPAWKLRTGRMWGYRGRWSRREKMRLSLQDQFGDGGWFAYRRLVRGWRVANARGDLANPRRVVQAKRMLACREPAMSRVRGISEWVPQDVTLSMLANLASRGYAVQEDHGPPAATKVAGDSALQAQP